MEFGKKTGAMPKTIVFDLDETLMKSFFQIPPVDLEFNQI